jgi:Xaa-Pro aminopeptidase
MSSISITNTAKSSGIIRMTSAQKVAKLREILEELGVDGFLVPRTDEFQSEHVAPSSERLRWISNFTGSAGTAVITRDQALLFVDGRYTLQAKQQVDPEVFEIIWTGHQTLNVWFAAMGPDFSLAFDPWLHTEREMIRYSKAGIDLHPLAENPIDSIWNDKPEMPKAPIQTHDLKYAGQSHRDKIKDLCNKLHRHKVDACILTLSDSICWLLNIRGHDIPCSPVVLSYLIVYQDGRVDFFLNPEKVTEDVSRHLGSAITSYPLDQFETALESLVDKTVWVDDKTAPIQILSILQQSKAKLHCAQDPCILLKACKNSVELEGARQAHIRDGAALCSLFAWLEGALAKGTITEIDVDKKLLSLRQEQDLFQEVSFESITGAGAHGAIIHYRVNEKTNQSLEKGSLFLLDSGGQYLDGTTDVTRTIAIGKPGDEMKRHFTLVLKGHIAIATARFPYGTCGEQLDVLARMPLWREGLDYEHGTGHGVGSYLNVHEGPQRIGKQVSNDATPLMLGMIVSNEPGYYAEGAYGIRIESLVAVREANIAGTKKYYEFETLTMAPICIDLIDQSLLTNDEITWLNDYHALVLKTLSPHVDDATHKWLKIQTRAL